MQAEHKEQPCAQAGQPCCDEFELKATIMDEAAVKRATVRIAHEIIEHNEGAQNIVLVGIIRRGEVLSERLADEIEAIEGMRPYVGSLDISFYRDDVERLIAPVLHATNLPFVLDNTNVVLVDDVLYTGRTVRAALDALMDYGRPKCVQLAVMVDRGHRELPIRADYVGKNVPSSHEEDVRVRLTPTDTRDSVEIWQRTSPHTSQRTSSHTSPHASSHTSSHTSKKTSLHTAGSAAQHTSNPTIAGNTAQIQA